MKLRHPEFLIFISVLIVIIGSLLFRLSPEIAILAGFDIAASVFILLTIRAALGTSSKTLRLTAARDDGGRGLLLTLSAILLTVVLVVVGMEIHQRGQAPLQILLVVFTLVLAWLFTNLVYARHYAHLYYDHDKVSGSDHGGLHFPGTKNPDFWDFCYFAFVLGMTFQVSDVQIVNSQMRHAATIHGILAFLFNISVVALTVNVIASAR